MADNWSKLPTGTGSVNSGNQFEPNDAIVAADINACFNNAFYAVDTADASNNFATHLADTPNTDDAGNVGTPSVALVDNVVGGVTYKKFKFSNLKGATGAAGAAGGKWYSGTGITGTSTTATVFSGSGVSSAVVGDMYLNTSTSNTYRCTLGGNASTAKWVYVCNIKGAQGIAAGFGTPTATATTRNANQSATASVSPSGDDTSKVFAFTFGIPKGTTFTPSVDANGDLSWTNDGGKTNPSTVNIKGIQGDAGRGISSISKTGTSGLVDTYTINYTNNTTSTYTVTNGKAATVNGSTTNSITFSLSSNDTILNITVG